MALLLHRFIVIVIIIITYYYTGKEQNRTQHIYICIRSKYNKIIGFSDSRSDILPPSCSQPRSQPASTLPQWYGTDIVDTTVYSG